jgi:hypothetical protein
MGVVTQTRSMGPIDLEGSASHEGQTHGYHYQPRLQAGRAPQIHLLGGSATIHFLIRRLHLGFEMGVAGSSSNGPWQTNDDGLTLRSTSAVQGQAKVAAGYGTRFGKWGLLGEVHGGIRMTSLRIESRLGDSVQDDFTTMADPILEPRLTVQRWLSPWASADLSLGSDLFQDRDLSLSLNITAHSRAYDGFF